MRWLPTRPVYPPPKVSRTARPAPAASPRLLLWWFGGTTLAGLAAGCGLATPGGGIDPGQIYLLFGLGCAVLLALRLLARRPLTDFLSPRQLGLGCCLCVAGFLAGQWLFAVGIVALRGS